MSWADAAVLALIALLIGLGLGYVLGDDPAHDFDDDNDRGMW